MARSARTGIRDFPAFAVIRPVTTGIILTCSSAKIMRSWTSSYTRNPVNSQLRLAVAMARLAQICQFPPPGTR